MQLAEHIFELYFRNDEHYQNFKSIYEVNIYDHDADGNEGSYVEVLAAHGGLFSFEDKPAAVNVVKNKSGSDFGVIWCCSGMTENGPKVVLHRPIEDGPAVYKYKYAEKTGYTDYYSHGFLLKSEKTICKRHPKFMKGF